MSSLTLTARLVFPVEGPPIEQGRITIEGGRITSVGPASTTSREPDLDLGNVAILPGFVNAHTHLELGPNDGTAWNPGNPAEDEIDWLTQVVARRRAIDPSSRRATVDTNIQSSLEAGTTLLADTTTAGLSWNAIADAPVRSVVFAEIIGLRRMRGLETSTEAWDWINSITRADQVAANARPGLSPHAPYSTAGWLYHRAVASRLPLSTHLAELPEELELLKTRGGRMRGFLEGLGAWDEKWEPISPHPADYIRRGELREADWIVAHGTYLSPDDFWQLRPEAAPGSHRVAVAYCPRTTARFGHAPHPFREMLEHGVVVCLGTDSLASSPTLGVLDEMRFLHAADPTLGGPLLLTMGTLFGAWALKADTVTGSLRAGKSADLAIVALPDREESDPHRLLLEADDPVVGSMYEGRFVTGPAAWRALSAPPHAPDLG